MNLSKELIKFLRVSKFAMEPKYIVIKIMNKKEDLFTRQEAPADSYDPESRLVTYKYLYVKEAEECFSYLKENIVALQEAVFCDSPKTRKFAKIFLAIIAKGESWRAFCSYDNPELEEVLNKIPRGFRLEKSFHKDGTFSYGWEKKSSDSWLSEDEFLEKHIK